MHSRPPPPILLNFGVMSSAGVLDVRIIYDHRVMNGATVARALGRLGEILNSVILEEVQAFKGTPVNTVSL
jgi:pyruvate/2-oxoglutarate dehydrogenase complex dihydrolipoamide acyltransferase (E2) component